MKCSNFFAVSRDKHDPIGLEAFLLTAPQNRLDLVALVEQLTTKT
ncbi:hypothetical protein SAMN05216466_12182 [Paraburkholderia phenazinium]|uniref:Uncharacterized protein n=1 Tax=Paraburkholderia phenazinium TaxID=60549 RepID=A0A1G8JX80_9BURK|nr:hypothetical protein SAMN05216466_12182 [Paraburkholderia phenazinium]